MVEETLKAQRINLAPGRAERIEAALKATLDAVQSETPRLDFDADATGHAVAMERLKA